MSKPNDVDQNGNREGDTDHFRSFYDTPSIATMVTDNHSLITVLGVFVALTIFSSNLPLQPFGYVLSFLFVTASILLWKELINNFPPERGTEGLYWFENILTFSMFVFFAYWVVQYRKVVVKFLFMPIALVLLSIISVTMKRNDAFNRFFNTTHGQHKTLRNICWFILIMLTLLISGVIQALVAPHLGPALDTVFDELSHPTM